MKMFWSFIAASVALAVGSLTVSAAEKRIVLVAGARSHSPQEHEFRAGCLLLKSCLDKVPGVTSVVVTNGWPAELKVFEGAAAILIYADGGDGHPFIRPERLKVVGDLMKRGVGLGAAHYGVEVPKDRGGREFLEWTGGYFETYWSVNPHWEARFTNFPAHPVTRGVKPFKVRDEWYYHMRFPEGMKNVTPLLTAVPPEATRGRPGANDPHGGNPEVQKHQGEPEHVMWCTERPDGGRGFGFTGGHFHQNWADNNFRKIVLNALLWIAKVEVPMDGVESNLTPEQFQENLDPKEAKKPKSQTKAEAAGVRAVP